MVALVVILVILAVAGLIAAGRSVKIVQQYEQGIIFRFGRVLPGTRSAGLTLIRPVGDRMQRNEPASADLSRDDEAEIEGLSAAVRDGERRAAPPDGTAPGCPPC